MLLVIEFTHYWHCGSGQSGGKKLDALVEKTQHQLPFVPGKTLKGVLREAVRQAQSFGVFRDYQTSSEYSVEALLFGTREDGKPTDSGLLAVSDGRLSDAETAYLQQSKKHIPHLYQQISRTAIDHQTGAAIDKSLRSQEVSVPMVLTAEVDYVSAPHANATLECAQQQIKSQIRPIIELSLPLITAIGGLRQRGLGRCIVTLQGEAQ